MLKSFLFYFIVTISLYAQTIKDISNIVGIRDNQLIGYGLVVGLAGTGDKSKFAMQSLKNLLQNSYIKIPTSAIKSKNIASVMVTATLPPFSHQGDKIKLNISSLGDAKSIDKGQLLLTQLKGLNGEVYAIAQGQVVSNTNNPTTGYIYNGAIIENEINFSLKNEKKVTISLLEESATNANMIEEKINDRFDGKLAQAIDTRTIEVIKPKKLSMIKFISEIQKINITSNIGRKIIIDTIKKTIVSGEDVAIKPITIVRNDFVIRIKHNKDERIKWDDVALNNPESNNTTKELRIEIPNIADTKQPTVSDLMRAMTVMKLDMNDIVQTLQAIEKLGAINAKIETVR